MTLTSHPQVIERCGAVLCHLEYRVWYCYRLADRGVVQKSLRLEEETETQRHLGRAVVGES